MSRYAIAGAIPGLLVGHVGRPLRLVTGLSSAFRGLELHASLTDEGTGQVDLRVGDGTTWATLSITAGQRSASVPLASVLWPLGADLDLEITADAGGDAYSLAVTLFVETSGVAGVAAEGLITLAALETALGLSGLTAEQQNYLQRQIDVGSAVIRSYTGRHISLATYRERWAQPGIVRASGRPLVSIVSASHAGGTLDPGADLVFEPDTGRVWRVSGTARLDWSGLQNVDLVTTAGWDPVPPPVTECLLIGIWSRWQGWASSRGLVLSQTISRVQFPDAGAISYGADAGSLRHQLTGFPLELLEDYVDVTGGLAPSEGLQVWEHYTP